MTTHSQTGGALPPDWADELRFHDRRPPVEIKIELERKLVVLLDPVWDGPLLTFRGIVKPSGVAYRFDLRFEAAFKSLNCHLVRAEASWSHLGVEHHDYYLKSSASWFRYWTGGYREAPPLEVNCSERYLTLAEQAFAAEAKLADVSSIQREILSAMYRGESFCTAHKEGGTTFRWNTEQFVIAGYGESDEFQLFKVESAFLSALRKFYDWTVSRNAYPGKPSELDAWKLILRQLRR